MANGLYPIQLLSREIHFPQGLQVVFELCHGTCPDNDRRNQFVLQNPSQGHFSQRLPPLCGHPVQGFDFLQDRLCQYLAFQESPLCHTRIFGHALQIAGREQTLRQR